MTNRVRPYFLLLIPLLALLHAANTLEWFLLPHQFLLTWVLLMIPFVGLYLADRSIHHYITIASAVMLCAMVWYADLITTARLYTGHPIQHRFAIPALLCGCVMVAMILSRWQRLLSPSIRYLNLLLPLLCGYEIITTLSHTPGWKAYASPQTKTTTTTGHHSGQLPDIYFILADAYASDTVLKKVFQFDNTFFTDSLQQLGFSTRYRFTSNYRETILSVSSILNMRELPDISGLPNQYVKNTICRQWINQSEFTKALLSRGYHIRNLSLFHINDTDPYTEYDHLMGHGLSFYEFVFETTLPGRIMAERYFLSLQPGRNAETLTLASAPGEKPAFTYAHVLMPHKPYYFDAAGNLYPDGKGKYPENEYASYLEYLQYCNTRLLACVSEIVKTNPEAVIIILGDHGPRFLENTTPDAVFNPFLATKGIALPRDVCGVNLLRHVMLETGATAVNDIPCRQFNWEALP